MFPYLRHNGSGVFAAPVNYATGNSPRFVCLSDLDNDGDYDLAISNFADNDVTILLNNGDATFAYEGDYAVGENPMSISAADFNSDGYEDLAVVNRWSRSVSILINQLGIQICEPGEADGIPPINILDIVYILNYKYKEGPAPIPYALCSGDPNKDCLVNILDPVYLLSYKYKGGPAPATSEEWVLECGLPIRK